MSRISRNLSIVLRSERLIAQRQFTIAARRTGLYAAAGLAVGLAVIMLNVAGYFALSETLSKPLSALLVAAANLVLAVLLALFAKSMSSQSDSETVTELRDMALADIEEEIRDGLTQAQDAITHVKKMSRDPFGTIAPELAAVIVKILARRASDRSKTDQKA